MFTPLLIGYLTDDVISPVILFTIAICVISAVYLWVIEDKETIGETLVQSILFISIVTSFIAYAQDSSLEWHKERHSEILQDKREKFLELKKEIKP
jgi:hypothetical protein